MWMWNLVAGVTICLAALSGILINVYVLLALLLAKQVPQILLDNLMTQSLHMVFIWLKKLVVKYLHPRFQILYTANSCSTFDCSSKL